MWALSQLFDDADWIELLGISDKRVLDRIRDYLTEPLKKEQAAIVPTFVPPTTVDKAVHLQECGFVPKQAHAAYLLHIDSEPKLYKLLPADV
jgi:hypothetical protein